MKKAYWLILVLWMGCTKGLDYKKYLVWYESDENPLRKKQVVGDVEYTCTYFTTDYFLAREMASGGSIKKMDEDSSEYYKLNIKIKDHSEPLTYKIRGGSESYERINYLVSNIKDDILLITTKDTLTCQMHHYERVYHVGNTLSVMFIFDKTNEQKQRTIVFQDNLFGNGIMTFKFDQNEIQQVPQLKK